MSSTGHGGGGSGAGGGAGGAGGGAGTLAANYLSTPGASRKEIIPPFYFPKGSRPGADAARAAAEKAAAAAFAAVSGKGVVTLEQFTALIKTVAELPCYFARRAFEKAGGKVGGTLTEKAFLKWHASCVYDKDAAERIFLAVAADGADSLTKKDFAPFMDEVVRVHPGLEFLATTPEFQEKYKETVILRIFYSANRSGSMRVTLKELRKSSFVGTVKVLEEEPDINKVTDIFSYEHFYVLYCKFWELDQDHDHLIDKEDLLRYSNYSLTYRIVDRIFAGIPRRLTAPEPGKMGYEDFCWFLLSEEDKTTPQSIEYWFRCVDLDGNGSIDPTEMKYFYQEQLQRMECISQEVVSFADVVCQLHDMIKPDKEGRFTLKDLRRSPLASNFFNILFNLNKFIAFEQRDPFQMRADAAQGLSDWERFARAEYDQMALEDEQGDGGGGEQEASPWEGAAAGFGREAPF